MAAGDAAGYPDLVQIRARARVVEGVLAVVVGAAVGVLGVAISEVWLALWGTVLIGSGVLFSWMPCVVFGPEEMVVTNALRSRTVRYDDVTSITFNTWTWFHNRSLVLVSRTDGWVSVDAVRRRMILGVVGLDDQSRMMHREIERRVQLARSRAT